MTEVCAKWRQERLKSRDLSSRPVLALRTILYTSEGGRTNPTATLHEGTGYHGSAGLTHELALWVVHAACVRSFSKRVEASQEACRRRGPGLVVADRRRRWRYTRETRRKVGRPVVFQVVHGRSRYLPVLALASKVGEVAHASHATGVRWRGHHRSRLLSLPTCLEQCRWTLGLIEPPRQCSTARTGGTRSRRRGGR